MMIVSIFLSQTELTRGFMSTAPGLLHYCARIKIIRMQSNTLQICLNNMSNLSQHERTTDGKEEWLTDPAIIKALEVFDLDPCAPVSRPWDMANRHYTIADDGLIQPWEGRVWLNPPYGLKTRTWIKLLSEHGNGIALIYARTETKI